MMNAPDPDLALSCVSCAALASTVVGALLAPLTTRLRRAGGRMLSPFQRWALWRWQDIHDPGADGHPLYLRKLYLLRTPWCQAALHWFLRPDGGRDLHDHPRSFVSVLLRGGYLEARPAPAEDARAHAELIGAGDFPDCDLAAGGWYRYATDGGWRTLWQCLLRRDWRLAPSVAYRRAEDAHRIAEVLPGTVTLVLWGPGRRAWGFHTREGWVAWRTYLGVGQEVAP